MLILAGNHEYYADRSATLLSLSSLLFLFTVLVLDSVFHVFSFI